MPVIYLLNDLFQSISVSCLGIFTNSKKVVKLPKCLVLESNITNLVTEPSMVNWVSDQNMTNLAPKPNMVNLVPEPSMAGLVPESIIVN